MRKYHSHYYKFTTIPDPANFPINVTLRKCYVTLQTVHYKKHVVVCCQLMVLLNGKHDVTVYFMAACTSFI